VLVEMATPWRYFDSHLQCALMNLGIWVRTLVLVGTVSKTEAFSEDVKVNLNTGNSRNIRLVAFAEDKTAGSASR
jgi:hypothetical protein